MNKLSFRARPLEASKPMLIFMSEEIPDLPEYSAISRAVPQMPSGMKKEEECEHHLQRAMVTGLIIPTPEVIQMDDITAYNRMYPPDYKAPKQLIHMQPFSMEQENPDYDMDSEDEKWLSSHKNTELTATMFENMMDKLEKNSGHSVVTQQEAIHLLKEKEDLVPLVYLVYDYWLNKRLRTQQNLIPLVKTDPLRGGGSVNNSNNPYVAFRRRTEKMQTRKNRKNDESTYEKMVKLKRDLSRAVSLLEMVKNRENWKKDMAVLTCNIFDQRYNAQDFSGQLLSEVSSIKTTRPAFAPLFTNQYNHGTSWSKQPKDDYMTPRKEKRQYKKRKHKSNSTVMHDVTGVASSGDDDGHTVSPTSPSHDDAPFAFRRKRQCQYHAPLATGLGNWPWTSQEEGGLADQRFRFNLASISTPTSRCVGLARRRVGRGGRVILDRAGPPRDDFWAEFDFTVLDNKKESETKEDRLTPEEDQPLAETYQDWLHFRPKSPVKTEQEEDDVYDIMNSSSLSLVVEDLTEPSSELLPVHLNLSELFPSLSWEADRREEVETVTPPNESDCGVTEWPSEPVTSEILLSKLSAARNETVKTLKRACQSEYQSGSLLDRWARFESRPPEPVKKPKPVPIETFTSDDVLGCSAFRTSNSWPEPKSRTVSESSALTVEDSLDVTSNTEDAPHLPPTPPKERKTPPPSIHPHRTNNLSPHTNGPISLDMANNRILSKHIGSNAAYRKKNNHLHPHGLNSKLIMRLHENTGDIIETTVDKETLIRKATQVPMEVT